MNFKETSYNRHKEGYSNIDGNTMDVWALEDTVDYWRHKRMYDTLLPVLHSNKNKSWLTVGDGRYGTDAHYLLKYTSNVMASDIAEDCLKVAKSNKYIEDYKLENAENMSFNDDTFDYVLCKEAYHHFPRPVIALYEMLRVAKEAIILIEPNDSNQVIPQKLSFRSSYFWFFQSIKNFIKKSLGKKAYYSFGNYEEVGNYVFSISEREIEKIALGLNLDVIAIKGLNDTYLEGCENEKIDNKGEFYKKISSAIDEQDRNVRLGKRNWGLITAIIFKKKPSDETLSALVKAGYDISILSKNPYL